MATSRCCSAAGNKGSIWLGIIQERVLSSTYGIKHQLLREPLSFTTRMTTLSDRSGLGSGFQQSRHEVQLTTGA